MKCCREITIEGTDLRVYPSGSIWRSNVISKKWSQVKSTTRNGYLHFAVNKKFYFNHRVIAHAYFGFDLSSKMMIDHRDRNPLNNSVWNLREVSSQENSFNTSCKGISFDNTRNRWIAYIYINKIQKSKRFETEDDATAWREEMKKIHYIISEPDYKKIMSVCLGDI